MMAAEQLQWPTLYGLLDGLVEGLAAVPDCHLSGVQLDSRKLEAGNLFIALAGGRGHGALYVDSALERGAAAILLEAEEAAPPQIRSWQGRSVPVLTVPGLRALAGVIAARFYGHPSRAMTVIGITGTNGKTSVSQFIAQALNPSAPCGVIGTLGSGLWGRLVETGHTTPDAVSVQAELAKQREAGARSVAMEVSSHGLDQARVSGVSFDVAVFTNLSHDHLDYHGDMAAYAMAKQALFKQPGLKVGVLNLDDETGRQWYQALQGELELIGYSLKPELAGRAELVAETLELSTDGIELVITSPWGRARLSSPLLGRFNASNLLAALGALLGAGLALEPAVAALQAVRTVPGRMERFEAPGRALVVVDYAHTPDALEQALRALREHHPQRLLCVFGCGGDRDREKRPVMGAVAARLADTVIVTDDNPRHEDPDAIVREIVAGMGEAQVRIERDRAAAIAAAIAEAGVGDIVLVAGKGHESYQQVGDTRLPFSDRAVVEGLLRGGDA